MAKRGRPCLNESERRSKVVHVRIKQSEYDQLVEYCKKNGVPMSDFLQAVIRKNTGCEK